MTPISIPCPHCGAVLKVRDAARIGHRAKCPKCAQAFRLEVAAGVGATSAVANEPPASPEPVLPNEPDGDIASLPQWPTADATSGAAGRLQLQRRKNRRRTLIAASVSAVIVLAAGSVGMFVMKYAPKRLEVDDVAERADNHDAGDFDADLSPSAESRPIDLQFIPAGTRIVIHVHPAELWQPDSRGEEFRFCLGPISEFLGARIKDFTKREPSDVAEALFCLIPNERGTPPDVAAVFRLKEDAKKSELLDQFGGKRAEGQDGTPYYLTPDQRAYLFPDLRTIAVCPAKSPMVDEMIAAVNDRNPTSPGIEELLLLTDRSRPMTVVFEPVSLEIDAEFLLPPTAIPLLQKCLEWLGPDVETAAWSLHWQNESMRSEIVIRNQGGREAHALERRLQRQLDDLPENILAFVKQMAPREAGKRKLVGRFPVMTKAFALASRTQAGTRSVRIDTRLPERAAPNLALGALLTWDESTRMTPGAKPFVETPSDEKPDAAPIAEKLKRKITVEFKREPLQNAFAYIANEIKASLEIDGDALKLSAYTKNMPQTFSMDNSPAIDVIERILKQPMYEKMCLVVDEKKNSLLITTYPVAEQQGLKPYEFAK